MTFRQKLANLGFGIAQTGYFLRPRVLRENFRTVVERKRIGMANPAGLLWRYADNARLVIGHSLFGIEHPFPKAPGNLCMLGPLMPRERLAGPSGSPWRRGWTSTTPSSTSGSAPPAGRRATRSRRSWTASAAWAPACTRCGA